MEFKKFPSIPNLRNFRKENSDFSEIDVYFSEKLHGTNGCVIVDFENERVGFQNRNRLLSEDNDNANFCKEMKQRLTGLKVILDGFYLINDLVAKKVYVYGEWCGKKIQKNSIFDDIDTYEKFFFVFPRILVQDLDGNWSWGKYKVRDNSLFDNIGVIPEFEAKINLDFIQEKVEQTKISYIAQDFFGIISEKKKQKGRCFIIQIMAVLKLSVKNFRKTPKPKKVLTPIPKDELLEVIEEWRLRQFLDEFKLQNKTDYKDISAYVKAIIQDIEKENKDKFELLKEKYGKSVGKSISKYAVEVFKREFNL